MKALLKDRYWQITVLFVLVKLGMHLAAAGTYELHRDEMLYFSQGAHPDFGNATVPPFIGWVAFLIKSLFGHSVFGIRLVAALTGAFSVVLMAKIVKELGGGIPALVMSGVAFLFAPGFLLVGSLFTVNIFEHFFWLLIIWLFMKMIRNDDPKFWIWIALVSGLAFLNKYLVVYLLAGFAVVMLMMPHRRLFLSWYFLLAIVAGLAIVSPNIYWQYAHNWPILFHLSELQKSQMVHMTAGNFFADLFSLFYMTTFFWLGGLIAVLFLKSEKEHRYLAWVTIVVILLFLLSKGKAYYVLGLFPPLLALSGYLIEKHLIGKFRPAVYLVPALIIGFSALAMPFSIPLLSFEKLSRYADRTAGFVSYPFSRWEDGKIHEVSQVFSDMTGWEEMVALVNEAWQQIPENERPHATIYAERNYGYAGAVHFYGKQYNLPDAVTFLDSFVLWAPDTIARGPLVFISYDIAGLDRLFERYTEIGIVGNPYFREKGLKVFLYENPGEDLQLVYAQKAKAEKRVYSR